MTTSATKHRPSSIPKSIEAFAEKPVRTTEEYDCEKKGYKLSKTTLGKGAYAKVKLAYVTAAKLDKDKRLAEELKEKGNNKVAIKIISKKNAPVEYLNKFMPREIETLHTAYGSTHVTKLYETFRSESRVYLVMEYASKGDLLEYINSRSSKIPGIGENQSKKFFKELVEGVAYCHRRNVVHRDLKCENILIDEDEVVKISDFGFATRYPTTKQKLLETFCGSYAYAAPEILQAEKYDGKKADIWSLGVILFAMLNGRLPFNDRDIRSLIEQTKGKLRFSSRVQLSVECQDLVRRILHPEPLRRITIYEILQHPWMGQVSSQEKLLTHYRGVPDGKSREIFAEKFDVGRLDRRTGTPNEEVDPKTETEAQNGDRPVQKLEGSNQPQRVLNRERWSENKDKKSSTMSKLLRSRIDKALLKEKCELRAEKEEPTKEKISVDKKLFNKPVTQRNNAQQKDQAVSEKAAQSTPKPKSESKKTLGLSGYRHQIFKNVQDSATDSVLRPSETKGSDNVKDVLGKRKTSEKYKEINVGISNLKNNGFLKLYYPGERTYHSENEEIDHPNFACYRISEAGESKEIAGLHVHLGHNYLRLSQDKNALGLSLPPVGKRENVNGNISPGKSASAPGRINSKVSARTKSRESSSKGYYRTKPCCWDLGKGTVTTEIINLRKNYQSVKPSNKQDPRKLTFYTLSGREIQTVRNA